MRIGFDLFERATYPFRGIARYEQYLAEALASLDTPDEDMPSLYKLAGALVFPTFMGPTSIPIIEAFAAGCPVICSNVEGYGDQVGDAGILIDPTSPNDLAQAIHLVYTDENLRERLIKKGKARFKQMSSDDYGREIFEIVQKVLQTR